MVQNAVQNAGKREVKSINIHRNGINKTLSSHEKHGRKGAKRPSKSRVLGVKSAYLELKNYELATKIERQNGAKCT